MSDLDLKYIGKQSAQILSAAELEGEIPFSDIRILWDTIGELIGEVERLDKLAPEDPIHSLYGSMS